jgi:pimeloyl-ACP methyl ester carboxylesterase
MDTRITSLFWLVLAALACAEEPTHPPLTPASVRAVLEDPDGDLARLAKGALGPAGGNQLFYFPTHDEPATPATWGFKFENIDFKSADGTLVFSHGNAGSIGHHLGFVTWLAEAGYNVMMYDYCGFGKSGGSVDRRGMADGNC